MCAIERRKPAYIARASGPTHCVILFFLFSIPMKVQINNTTAGHVLYLDGVEIADSDHAYNIASEVGAIDNDGNIIS